MTADLNALAARAEAATGASTSIDWDIEEAIGDWQNIGGARMRHKRTGEIRGGHNFPRGAYTASLDAALTLVPQDAFWRLGHDGEGPDPALFLARVLVVQPGRAIGHCDAVAATPALALVAASLRARSAQGEVM